MAVDIATIREMFRTLLAVSESRASIASLALRYQEEDHEKLGLLPESEFECIWNALVFLEGVDLKDGQNSYLHSIEDIERECP